jgi:hypothetical protein
LIPSYNRGADIGPKSARVYSCQTAIGMPAAARYGVDLMVKTAHNSGECEISCSFTAQRNEKPEDPHCRLLEKAGRLKPGKLSGPTYPIIASPGNRRPSAA